MNKKRTFELENCNSFSNFNALKSFISHQKSKNMKVFIFIIWLILGFIYFWLWDRGVDRCCNDERVKIETAVINKNQESTQNAQKQDFPISFHWGKSQIVKGSSFKAYKDSLIATLGDGRILEITGYYYEGELNNSGMDNLGLARAMEIRKLFPEISDDKIRLYGKLDSEKLKDRDNAFAASSFSSAVNNANVKEIDNSALIYFPYNSTKKLENPKIDSYLDDVAKRVIKTNEKVFLTGHTDSYGPEDANYELGLRRAQILKQILIEKGVPEKNIVVKSKGEKFPIAPNNTPVNRSKNRRVELKILK